MHGEEQEKSQDTKHIYRKYNVDVSPKQKVKKKKKDIYAGVRKWQKQGKLSGVSLVLQFILYLEISTNSFSINLDG